MIPPQRANSQVLVSPFFVKSHEKDRFPLFLFFIYKKQTHKVTAHKESKKIKTHDTALIKNTSNKTKSQAKIRHFSHNFSNMFF